MTNHRHTHYNFGFIAGTLLGIGWQLWTNRDQNISISKPKLKKVIREYTDKIPDHIDYLVDKIYDQDTIEFNLSTHPSSPPKTSHRLPQNFFARISSFFNN